MSAGAPSAAQAREAAEGILSQSRFHSPGLPRPLHGVFQALGGWLRPVGRALADAAGWIGRAFRHHPAPGAVVVLIVIVALGLGGRLLVRRAGRRRERAREERGPARPLGPEGLRRQAAAAEARGDAALALRLYFSATLLELQAAGRLPPTYSLTAGQARRALGSARFDRLAGAFEAAAYGGRAVSADDLELARQGRWADPR